MHRLLRALLMVLLVCVGCGGGDASKSSTPTTARDGDSRSKAELAADKEAAEAALLKAADFPADWTTEPPNDDTADPPDRNADLADCLHVDRALLADDEKVSAESTFAHAGLQVLSSVGMQPTRAAAERQAAVFARPEYPHCLESEMGALRDRKPGAQPPAGVEMGDITITELELGPYGEDSRAFRAEIAVSAPGRSGSLFVDLAFIRVGRATGTLAFRSFGIPFDDELKAELATTFASRLPKH